MKFYKKQAAGDLPILSTPAGSSNIEKGKQAIDSYGNIIEGTLGTMYSIGKVASTVEVSGDNLEMSVKYDSKNIIDKTTTLKLKKDLTNFGTATAADVAAGKTFTSIAGFKVTGTKESGAVLPTLSNPAAASDIASGKQAIDGEGNLITGTGLMFDLSTANGNYNGSAAQTVPAGAKFIIASWLSSYTKPYLIDVENQKIYLPSTTGLAENTDVTSLVTYNADGSVTLARSGSKGSYCIYF